MTATNILWVIGQTLLYLPKVFGEAYLQLWRTWTGEMIIITFLMEFGDALITVTKQTEAKLIIALSLWLIIFGLLLWVVVNSTISGYRQGETIRSLSSCSRGIFVHLGLLLLISHYFWKSVALT